MSISLIDIICNGYNLLLVYLLTINVITFVMFCVDKHHAIHGQWRIKEATLLGLSLIGGSIGGMFAMRIAHHKTRKLAFRIGLPVIFVIELFVLLYFNFQRLL